MIATADKAAGNVREIRVTLPPPHGAAQRDLIETPDSIVLLGGGRFVKTEAEVRRVVR